MNELDNKKFWNERWQSGKQYEPSWPGDMPMRRLELSYIATCLEMHQHNAGHRLNIIELGCGAFTLSESSRLLSQLRRASSYAGVDRDEAAIRQAKERYDNVQMSFRVMDLTDDSQLARLPHHVDFLICRRTLQNLTKFDQVRVSSLIRSIARHAVIIETSKIGHQRLCAALNKDVPEPEFNNYLEDATVRSLNSVSLPGHPFAGYYYATRVNGLARTLETAVDTLTSTTVPHVGPSVWSW